MQRSRSRSARSAHPAPPPASSPDRPPARCRRSPHAARRRSRRRGFAPLDIGLSVAMRCVLDVPTSPSQDNAFRSVPTTQRTPYEINHRPARARGCCVDGTTEGAPTRFAARHRARAGPTCSGATIAGPRGQLRGLLRRIYTTHPGTRAVCVGWSIPPRWTGRSETAGPVRRRQL